jgi:hypothetical protein
MYQNFGSANANVLNFAGDTQDVVVGTYVTPNGELNPNQGRWISAAPAHSSGNAYSYATDPLNYLGSVDTTSGTLQQATGNTASKKSPLAICRSAGGADGDLGACLLDAGKTIQKIMNKDYTPQFPTLSSFDALVKQVEPADILQNYQLADSRIDYEVDWNPFTDEYEPMQTSCFFNTAGGTRSACSGYYTGFGWADFWTWVGPGILGGSQPQGPGGPALMYGVQGLGVFNFGDPSVFGNPAVFPQANPDGSYGDDGSDGGSGSGGGSGGSSPIPPDCWACSYQ